MKRSIIGITLTAGLLAAAASTGALAANGTQAQGLNQPQIQDSVQPSAESARTILFRGRERITSMLQHRTQAANMRQEPVEYSYVSDVSGINGGGMEGRAAGNGQSGGGRAN